MRLKAQVIVNPASNKGRTRRRWAEIRAAIRGFIKEFKCEFTEKPLHASEIARQAVKEGVELVIGVGGDGTINEIANGFYENERLINPEATIGILPSGTGCDLTRSLNIPPGLGGALKVITEAPSVRMDVGRVTYTNNEGAPEERFFLNVADFGLGGEVVRRVNERRLRRKASSYVRCLISAMAEYRSRRVSIRVDDRDIPEGRYLIGAVANGRVFGKGMKVAPLASLDDGLFDAILVKSMSFLEFCLNGWKLINGSHLGHPKVSFIRGRSVEAAALEPAGILLELDGEQVGRLPARFELLPGSLPVKGYPARG
jgi:YegS/Rv2252/BmrU family lipid kinase